MLKKQQYTTACWFVKKLKAHLPYYPFILFLGVNHEHIAMHSCTQMSIAALFAIAKTGNKPNIYEQVNWFF